jgi:hypothetical protein
VIIVRGKLQTEVVYVRRIAAAMILIGAVAFIWGCVEDITPSGNSKPKIWFTRAPREGREVFDNSVSFEWIATDVDDDLGMGQVFVALDPYLPCVIDTVTFCPRPDSCVERIDTLCIMPVELALGPVRVYQNNFDVDNLPDTTYTFSVIVRDGRGAETVLDRGFQVRFDNEPPLIDSVKCPPYKPANPVFEWTYEIFSHDIALNQASASPEESLTYWYRFVVPSGGTSIEAPDFKREYKTLTVTVDGQSFKGVYKFRGKSRDRAGNVSQEYVCEFEVTGPK